MSIFSNLLEVLGRHKSGSIFCMQIGVLLSSKMDGLERWAWCMSQKNGVLDLSHLFSPALSLSHTCTHTRTNTYTHFSPHSSRHYQVLLPCKFTLKNTPFTNPFYCVFDKKDFNGCVIIQEDVSSAIVAENVPFTRFLFPQYLLCFLKLTRSRIRPCKTDKP